MLSKFKAKSVGGGSFQTHFYHNREQSCALVQTQPSLIEVYEAEIRRLREENRNLKIQHNTMANQLNEVLAQLQQANAEKLLQKQRIIETKNVFYNTKKDFWQLTPAARNNKKRKVRQLVAQSVEGLKEFEPIEVRNNFTFTSFATKPGRHFDYAAKERVWNLGIWVKRRVTCEDQEIHFRWGCEKL